MSSFWHVSTVSGPQCSCPSSTLSTEYSNSNNSPHVSPRKENLEERSSIKLSSCKPQLSLMRDKDKRLPFSSRRRRNSWERDGARMEKSDERESYSGKEDVSSFSTLSFEQLPREKTNGLNSANNGDRMTLFEYFSASVPFPPSILLSLSTSMKSCCGGFFQSPFQQYHHQNNHLVQFINNNNSNPNGREPFFSKMVKGNPQRCSSCEEKTSRRGFKKWAFRPFIIYYIFISVLFTMTRGAVAIPVSGVPSPTQTIQDVAEVVSSLNPVYNERLSEELSKSHEELEPEILMKRQRTTEKDNIIDMNMTTNEETARKSNDYHHIREGKVIRSRSALPEANQQLSRSISEEKGYKVGSPHPTLPLTLEMKTKPLLANPKSTLYGHEQETLASKGNDPSSGGSHRNNISNKVDDDDDTDYKGEESNNSFLINNGSSSSSNDIDGDASGSGFINETFTKNTSSFLGTCWYTKVSSREMELKQKIGKEDIWKLSSPNSPFTQTLFNFSTSSVIHPDEHAAMFCNGTRNLALTLDQISDDFGSRVISIHVKDSSISKLNLSLFERFSRLASLSVTHSNVTHVIGCCPRGLLALNISFNAIRKVDSSVFNESISIAYPTSDLEENNGIDEEEDTDGGEDYSNDAKEDNDAYGGSSITPPHPTEKILSAYSSLREKLLSRQNNKSEFSQKMPAQSRLYSESHYGEVEKSMKKMRMVMATPATVAKQMISSSSLPTSDYSQSQSLELEGRTTENQYTFHPGDKEIQKMEKTLGIPVEKRRFIGVGKNTNEDESSNDDDEDDDDEHNDSHNGPETKLAKVNEEEMRKGKEPSPTSFYSVSASSGASKLRPTASAAGIYGCANNNKNNSLCKPQLTKEAKGDDIGEKGYEDDDEEDHLIHSRRQSRLREMKSESYTYELDQDGTSEGGDDYSMPDLRSSILPYFAASTKAKRSIDGRNEIKFEPTPSFHENASDNVVGMSVMHSKRGGKNCSMSLEDVDLSHNKISEVPRALLELKSLNSLRLSGNQLKCDFVWEKLADWYMDSPDKDILKDGDDTFCGVVDDVRVFQFTVLGVLKAKKDVVETCNKTVDKSVCHDCGLYSLNKVPGHGYNLTHESPHGNVAIALKLDCSLHNLTELPAVPPQTWQLNISGNSIKDLSPLKESMYENLLILDADSNEITSLDGLTGTTFLEKYNYFSLQNNRFSVIPNNFLASLKNMRGQGVTFLGANYIDCDCDVVREIKPLLLENSKKIKDMKEIYCKNLKMSVGDTFVALKDVQYADLCYMDTEESYEIWLYLVIFVELLLIILIVGKVWHDQRTFRRTGILPWCSAKMPRLPCDAMLESVKEPPHFNRSNSVNVRSFAASGSEHPTSQSISSHVQLREVRSNSGQSEKSSQISQLSSFPCSSRTSSV